METEEPVVDVIDVELSECDFVDEASLNEFNVFESVEVDIPDGIDIDEINELSARSEDMMCSLPSIQFCDENDIHVAIKSPRTNRSEEKYMCPFCKKTYIRISYYKNHLDICSYSSKKKEGSKKSSDDNQTVSHKTKKKKVKEGYVSVSDEELLSVASQMFKDALLDAIHDPKHNLVTGSIENKGNKVKKFAEEVLELFQKSPELFNMKENIIFNIACAVRSVNLLKDTSRENMWKVILVELRENSCDTWAAILSKLNSKPDDNLVGCLNYYVHMNILRQIIKFDNNHTKVAKIAMDLKLTDEEQNVLYYVAGFVIFALLKKYKKILQKNNNNHAASAAVIFLNDLMVTGDCGKFQGNKFLEFTKSWTEMRDRGGLVKVNFDVFLFIRRIENSVRVMLNASFIRQYQGQDIRDGLAKEIHTCNVVTTYWDSLSRNLDNSKLKQILKQQIIDKWIDIRARSFVNSYVQMIRRKLNKLSCEEKAKKTVVVSKLAEPALRKTLT